MIKYEWTNYRTTRDKLEKPNHWLEGTYYIANEISLRVIALSLRSITHSPLKTTNLSLQSASLEINRKTIGQINLNRKKQQALEDKGREFTIPFILLCFYICSENIKF